MEDASETDHVRCHENIRLSLPSLAKICPGEVGGINCGGDMGVRRCLARFLTSLALLRTPKSANGPRSNSFRPDSPSTTNFPRGRKTQPSPSPHRTWSVPDASSQPQLNLHLNRLKRNRCNTDIPLNLRLFLKIHGGAGRPGLPLRQNGSTGCAADNTGCN